MNNREKLPQSLRQRLVVLFQEVLAINKAKDTYPGLTFNRLSGAIYHELISEKNAHLTEDEAVNLAVHMVQDDVLPGILAKYAEVIEQRHKQAGKQVYGIVDNMVPQDTPNRDQVIADTLNMLRKFTLVRSIPGIRKLVAARIANGNNDLNELDYMYTT